MPRHWIPIAILSLILAGCGPLDSVTPTLSPEIATLIAGITPLPPATDTPGPTHTPAPTETPLPTATATPPIAPPAVLERYMEGVALLNVQTFDQTTSAETILNGGVETLGDSLIIEAGGGKLLAQVSKPLTAGQGVLFLFRYQEDTEFNISYSHERAAPPIGGALSLAFRSGRLTFTGREGDTRYVEGLVGNLALEYGKWFGVALAVDSQGTGVVVVWDYEDPARAARNRFYFSQPGESWSLRLSVSQSTLWVDNYAEFRLDTVR